MVMESTMMDGTEIINNEHLHNITTNGGTGTGVHSNLDELCSLLRNEIPESRQTLLDTQSNLEKVADYCSSAYLEAEDKRSAFENTKNYTTHSLASVAYQINTLAYNILHMLDLQTNQISEMESQLNNIKQKFQFHNEKVARRKIALLTSAKTASRQPKVLIPANNEKQAKYIRKPIDFSIMDDIGHGVKIANPNFFRNSSSSQSGARMSGVQTLGPKSSMSSLSHYHHYNTLSGSGGPAPTTKPPTPPQAIRSGFGTLGRSTQNKEYRALVAPPIAPPQVPKNYESNYPIGHPKSNIVQRQTSASSVGTGGYATGQQQQPQPNSTTQYMPGMNYSHYHPGSSNISQASINSNISSTNVYGQSNSHQINNVEHVPPPPPQDLNDSLPDPPSPSNMNHHGYNDGRNITASPPLPPPPPSIENHSDVVQQQHHHPQITSGAIYGASTRQAAPDWAPINYIEKVIAIYDYIADKDDELTFHENSVIYVTRKNDDGWFEGVMNGETGLFPGNYVEPCL